MATPDSEPASDPEHNNHPDPECGDSGSSDPGRSDPDHGGECWDHRRTAAELGVTPETLYVWVNAGSGPPSHRTGRRRRYRAVEVRAYRQALVERFP